MWLRKAQIHFQLWEFYLEKHRLLPWLLLFDTVMFQILAFYLDFEYAKILCFGGCWRFLTGVWHLDLDLDMVTGHCYTHDLNFGFFSWFWRCEEHRFPSSPNLGFWRMQNVSDWGLVSLSWFGYCHWSFTHPCLKFGLSSWFWRCK